jgi:hypothetical protein
MTNCNRRGILQSLAALAVWPFANRISGASSADEQQSAKPIFIPKGIHPIVVGEIAPPRFELRYGGITILDTASSRLFGDVCLQAIDMMTRADGVRIVEAAVLLSDGTINHFVWNHTPYRGTHKSQKNMPASKFKWAQPSPISDWPRADATKNIPRTSLLSGQ